jgi:hypothetical protein
METNQEKLSQLESQLAEMQANITSKNTTTHNLAVRVANNVSKTYLEEHAHTFKSARIGEDATTGYCDVDADGLLTIKQLVSSALKTVLAVNASGALSLGYGITSGNPPVDFAPISIDPSAGRIIMKDTSGTTAVQLNTDGSPSTFSGLVTSGASVNAITDAESSVLVTKAYVAVATGPTVDIANLNSNYEPLAANVVNGYTFVAEYNSSDTNSISLPTIINDYGKNITIMNKSITAFNLLANNGNTNILGQDGTTTYNTNAPYVVAAGKIVRLTSYGNQWRITYESGLIIN